MWGAEESPIVWSRGQGAVVLDVDGNRYVDLTAGFGVVSLGHSAPEVARAVSAQARKLTQGLGDLMPHEGREMAERVVIPGVENRNGNIPHQILMSAAFGWPAQQQHLGT